MENIETMMDVASVVYMIVKQHPFFADAEDVIDAGQVRVEVPIEESPKDVISDDVV